MRSAVLADLILASCQRRHERGSARLVRPVLSVVAAEHLITASRCLGDAPDIPLSSRSTSIGSVGSEGGPT